MNPVRLLAISLVTVGCSSHEPKPPHTPSAPPQNVAPSKSALPPELAKLAKGGKLQAGPFSWPVNGTSAVVTDPTITGQARLVWHGPGGDGELHLPLEAAGGVVKDLTKDGTPELAIFAKPPQPTPDRVLDRAMVWLIGVDPTSNKPARMWLLESQVLGATDDASLGRELDTVSTFVAGKGVSPVKMIARLPDASPAELKELVGKQGVILCARAAMLKTCTTIAQSAIDAKTAKKIVAAGGVIGTFEPTPDPNGDLPKMLQPPECWPDAENPDRLDCVAKAGAQVRSEWIFERTERGLRLAEVWTWGDDS